MEISLLAAWAAGTGSVPVPAGISQKSQQHPAPERPERAGAPSAENIRRIMDPEKDPAHADNQGEENTRTHHEDPRGTVDLDTCQ